jgi:tetraacyldisaccharide 4'-kinase
MGGTGKSPHIEYLIRLLKDYLKIATLSRGYKRKSRGFHLVNFMDQVETTGDEPLQFKKKFRDIDVAVSESRTLGIPKLLIHNPELESILLDDAFQHRSVKPGLNILLTDYSRLFTRDFLLPSGNLREWRGSYKRADIIIVTKCPEDITQEEKQLLIEEIKPQKHQRIFFSKYLYGNPYYIFNTSQRIVLTDDIDVLLVSAIANTDYLNSYLETKVNSVRNVEYEDHHDFSNHDVSRIKLIFDNMNSQKKLILTTEKDAMRLHRHRNYLIENKVPIFTLPAHVSFLNEDGPVFDTSIKDFLLNFKV